MYLFSFAVEWQIKAKRPAATCQLGNDNGNNFTRKPSLSAASFLRRHGYFNKFGKRLFGCRVMLTNI